MSHTVHTLTQGSPDWHAFRAQHFTASEAPAMLGMSAYQTRSDLLKAKATGYTPEVDPATQRRFNAGHDAEAGARVIAEEEIGDDLYPITASRIVDGLALSASYDGATMSEEIIWEHKLANVGLIGSLASGVIPEQYHPQLEQQLLVIGAEKALFMASSGDRTAMECVWYTSNPELRARLIAGWKQFAIDIANYEHVEVIPAAVAAPQMGLPAVSITVKGSIALIDNLDVFGTALTAYVERINKTPETDQDFADLEATVKTLKNAEDALDASETNALAQTESIDTMRRTVAMYRETARTNRLLVEKLVKSEKENRRAAILHDGQSAFAAHIAALNDRLGKPYMPMVPTDFIGAMKGLKSIDSMRDKVATELARGKIEANAIADRITVNLTTLRDLGGEHKFLFADAAAIVLKAPDDLTMLVKSRIAEHQQAEAARLEAEREKIRAEEVERIEAANRQAVANAERAAQAKAASDAALLVAAQAPAEPSPVAPVTHEAVISVMPATVRQAMAPKAEPTSAPTLALGEISTRLGFNCTSAFLATLGFEATTVKAAKLFHEEEFQAICRALIEHIELVCETVAAVTSYGVLRNVDRCSQVNITSLATGSRN